MERPARLTDRPAFRPWIGRFLAAPRQVGAIAPSGPALARAMVAQVPPPGDRAILELGPGTGVFTAALVAHGIPADRVVAVEYDPGMAAALRRRLPGVRVACGDAFDTATLLDHAPEGYAAAISGLPLLNFPRGMGEGLIRDVLAAMPAGAPFVQFSYGVRPPIAPGHGLAVRRAGVIWRNLPPARVWVYSLS